MLCFVGPASLLLQMPGWPAGMPQGPSCSSSSPSSPRALLHPVDSSSSSSSIGSRTVGASLGGRVLREPEGECWAAASFSKQATAANVTPEAAACVCQPADVFAQDVLLLDSAAKQQAATAQQRKAVMFADAVVEHLSINQGTAASAAVAAALGEARFEGGPPQPSNRYVAGWGIKQGVCRGGCVV